MVWVGGVGLTFFKNKSDIFEHFSPAAYILFPRSTFFSPIIFSFLVLFIFFLSLISLPNIQLSFLTPHIKGHIVKNVPST